MLYMFLLRVKASACPTSFFLSFAHTSYGKVFTSSGCLRSRGQGPPWLSVSQVGICPACTLGTAMCRHSNLAVPIELMLFFSATGQGLRAKWLACLCCCSAEAEGVLGSCIMNAGPPSNSCYRDIVETKSRIAVRAGSAGALHSSCLPCLASTGLSKGCRCLGMY